MNVQVTQDQHWKAMWWLEERLDKKIYRYDVDDLVAMVEQVVGAGW